MADSSRGKLPIACSLPGPEFAARRDEASEVLRRSLRVEELEDGYAFEFEGASETAARLVEFVSAERSCCPFFLFELAFQPGEASIWLRVRGHEGTREFVREALLPATG